MHDSESREQERHRRHKRPILLKGGGRLMREKFQGKSFLIPSFITVVAVFCGFLAIISAIKGEFIYASKCIGLSIILDGLDGRVARKLNATSNFGKELDSLSDLVAFGVSPAVLVYCWAFARSADEFGVLIAFVFVVCGATRLARFNVITEGGPPSRYFLGLPTPGAAAAIASIVYCFPDPIEAAYLIGAIMVYMLVVAGLMVSTLSFFSVKHLKFNQGNPRLNIVVLAMLVAVFWKYSAPTILILSNAYALSGLVGFLWRRYFPRSWERQRSFLGVRP